MSKFGNVPTEGCLAPFRARTALREGGPRPAGLSEPQQIPEGWKPWWWLGEERAMGYRPQGTHHAADVQTRFLHRHGPGGTDTLAPVHI